MSRLLELEQRESRERSPVTVVAGDLETADTKAEERDKDSGCSGSLASLDDLLETQADFRVSLASPCPHPRQPEPDSHHLHGQEPELTFKAT